MAVTKEQLQNAVEVEAFLVVESHYEYNDENYYTTEGYFPEVVFLDRTAATAEAKRRQSEWEATQDADMWDGSVPDDLFQVLPIKLKTNV